MASRGAGLWAKSGDCFHHPFSGFSAVGTDEFQSLSDEATFAGQAKRARQAEVSLGGERTIGGNHATQETVIDDIEVVDLASRYKVEGTLGPQQNRDNAVSDGSQGNRGAQSPKHRSDL
jgi:hypothetical protein